MSTQKTAMLPLGEIASLKRTLMDEHQIYMHMHDSCGGGQSFSFDQPIPEDVKAWIINYFDEEKKTADFDEKGRSFVVFEGRVDSASE